MLHGFANVAFPAGVQSAACGFWRFSRLAMAKAEAARSFAALAAVPPPLPGSMIATVIAASPSDQSCLLQREVQRAVLDRQARRAEQCSGDSPTVRCGRAQHQDQESSYS